MSELYKFLKQNKKIIIIILIIILFFIPTSNSCNNTPQLIPNGTFLIYNAETKMYDQVFSK